MIITDNFLTASMLISLIGNMVTNHRDGVRNLRYAHYWIRNGSNGIGKGNIVYGIDSKLEPKSTIHWLKQEKNFHITAEEQIKENGKIIMKRYVTNNDSDTFIREFGYMVNSNSDRLLLYSTLGDNFELLNGETKEFKLEVDYTLSKFKFQHYLILSHLYMDDNSEGENDWIKPKSAYGVTDTLGVMHTLQDTNFSHAYNYDADKSNTNLNNGMVLGTGTMTNDELETDLGGELYKLENQITEGLEKAGNENFRNSSDGIVAHNDNGHTYAKLKTTFKNTSGSVMTINEIGMYIHENNSNREYILDRVKLDSPIIVQPDEIFEIPYNLGLNESINADVYVDGTLV